MRTSESIRIQQDHRSCLEKVHWKSLVLVIWPLILIPPLLIYDDKATRCAYVMAIMAIFWVTECLPLPVTSLLPIVLFPVLGIMQASDTIKCYIDETIMVFLTSLVLALALEHSNLHKRIALRTLICFGCSHGRLLAGFIVCTTFMSMWISNTAAAAMMIPIIFAVLEELDKEGIGKAFDVPPESTDPEHDRVPTKLTTAYLLATAWSASFGGSASLVGSPTNLAFKGIFEEDFPGAPPITFVDWLKVGAPQAFFNAFITWFYLLIFYMGLFRSRSNDYKNASISKKGQIIAKKILEKRCRELGSLSFHEVAVAVLFFICVFLWIFRQPGFVRGWGEYFDNKYNDSEEISSKSVWVSDASASMLIAILMFIIPKEPILFSAGNRTKPSSEGLITWKIIEQQMPWGIMFLIGGGFALAAGSNKSCFSKRISDSMTFLDNLHPYAIVVATCIIIGILTDFTSNVGTTNIVLPVIADVCKKIKNRHPWYLMFPAVLMCSYAFRTPSGTPPNGIVTMSANLPPRRLLIGGCGPAIYSLAVVTLFVPFWITQLHGESWEQEWLVARSGRVDIC